MKIKTTKRVTRTIVIEGEADWVDGQMTRNNFVSPVKFAEYREGSIKEIARTTTTTVTEEIGQ